MIQCVRGASEAGMSDISTALNALLQLAEERVRITTAYFVPDEEMTARLATPPTAASAWRSSSRSQR